MPKLRRVLTSSLKYYLYISDAKLDMLFEQIDRKALKHIVTEVKVDLKVASVTLRRAEDSAPSRIAKLRVVERFIDENHDVGTCEEPGREFFRGQMAIQWGWLGSPRNDAQIVCFRGEGESQLVILAGSRRHVIGESPEAHAFAGSALPHIVMAINDHISDRIAIAALPSQDPEWLNPLRAREIRFSPEGAPFQRMEFLAIALAEGRIADVHIVLGSPVYVAIASGLG